MASIADLQVAQQMARNSRWGEGSMWLLMKGSHQGLTGEPLARSTIRSAAREAQVVLSLSLSLGLGLGRSLGLSLSFGLGLGRSLGFSRLRCSLGPGSGLHLSLGLRLGLCLSLRYRIRNALDPATRPTLKKSKSASAAVPSGEDVFSRLYSHSRKHGPARSITDLRCMLGHTDPFQLRA